MWKDFPSVYNDEGGPSLLQSCLGGRLLTSYGRGSETPVIFESVRKWR
jgi:hypothetical protein